MPLRLEGTLTRHTPNVTVFAAIVDLEVQDKVKGDGAFLTTGASRFVDVEQHQTWVFVVNEPLVFIGRHSFHRRFIHV